MGEAEEGSEVVLLLSSGCLLSLKSYVQYLEHTSRKDRTDRVMFVNPLFIKHDLK